MEFRPMRVKVRLSGKVSGAGTVVRSAKGALGAAVPPLACAVVVLVFAGCGGRESALREAPHAASAGARQATEPRVRGPRGTWRPGAGSLHGGGQDAEFGGLQDLEDLEALEDLDDLDDLEASDGEEETPDERSERARRLLEGLDEGPLDDSTAEPEPRPTPPRRGGVRRAGLGSPRSGSARRGGTSPRNIFEDMALDKQTREADAAELVLQAESRKLAGELRQAEALLEKATLLDPGNEDAEVLLAEVRQLLGDSRFEISNAARDYFEREKLEREMVRTDVRRALAQAALNEELDPPEYERAIELYKRAIEMIRAEPFDLRLDEELRTARLRLERAEEKQKRREEEERRAIRKLAEQNAQAERESNLDYVRNQLRELYVRAGRAMEDQKFEKAVNLYSQVLEINPNDETARRRRAAAQELKYAHEMNAALKTSVENFKRAVLGVEQSSVIYQQIFRYPDREEWLRISPKVISIEEQVAQFRSPADNDVHRQLQVPYSYGVPEETPLKDVLAELQRLSNVNFFIRAGEAADIGSENVRFEPLENVRLGKLLDFILDDVGGGVGEEIGYVVKEGRVDIGPRSGLKERTYYQSYEISDLIRPRPDFKAPPIALDELQGQDATAGAGSLDFSFEEDAGAGPGGTIPQEELLQIISSELSEDGEADAGLGLGGVGAEPEGINILGGKLTANVTLDEHLKLAKILEGLRRSTGMMVTVESRFLDIQDNFLEQIGVDIGGTTSNLANTIPDADGAGTALAPGFEFIDAQGDFNLRAASIAGLSNPIGSQVNPFSITAEGGGAFQLNVLDAERYQLEAILTGVGKTQEVRRLNSPRITAFNTQTAHTLVIEQAAFIQDLEVNQTGVIPVINPVIGVLNTGSILELRPTISYDRKYVTLEIQPTLAEEIGRDVAVLNLSGSFTVVPVQLPILSVTKIKTTVSVPDGGTVLVGGLKREISRKTSVGLPFLRHVPLLNLVFGRKGQSTLRSNLFVLINANITIVHEEEEELFGADI